MNSVTTVKPVKPIEMVMAQLALPKTKAQLQAALPAHVPLDRFVRIAITAIQANPALLNCDRNSLFASVFTCAQLGLLPEAQLGEAYFVPFKGKVQLVIGYRGFVRLARQGDIGHIEADVFYTNDTTVYTKGDNSRFEVLVNWDDPGEIKGVYALAKFRDGSFAARVVMSKKQIDAIRSRSQNPNGPAWSNDYEEMAKKSAIRRLAKHLTLTTEADRAVRLSELHEERGQLAHLDESGQIIEGDAVESAPQEKPRRRRSALDDVVGSPSATPTTPPVQRPATSTDDDRPDLQVDPDTGEVIGGADRYFGEDSEPT